MKKKRLFPSLFVVSFILLSLTNYATTYYSRANTAWNVASTWSTVSCGGAAAVSIPTATDDVVICATYTVNIGTAGSCRSLTIDGTANWTSAVTTSVGTGGITIHSGGNVTGTVAGVLTTTGGLVLNSTLTSTTVSIRTITTAGQTITGTGSLARLDISANTINNGTITITTALLSTVASTLTQGSSSSLTYNGTSLTPTLDASAPGNTVNYGGTAQTVKAATYHHLTVSGSGIKTLGGAITVNGNLAINAGTLSTSTFQISGNATGTFSMSASTVFNIGSNSAVTDVLFPTSFSNANILFTATSTVVYYGNNSQTVSAVPTYANLTIQTFSGAKTANGHINVTGNLVTTSPTLLDMGTYNLGVGGSYTGTGRLSFSSGTFNIGGSFTNTGTFTCGTGTVNYGGAAAQTVRGVNYNNLTFSNVGEKQLQASATVGIAGTFTRGNMVVTAGASNTVAFNGASPVMTGDVTTFVNLTVTTGSLNSPANFTVSGNLVTTTPGVLNMTSYTLNLTGNYTGTGALSFTSGTFNITGNFTNTGTFTCGTGTVNYNSGTAQTVRGVNYYHLTFSGVGTKTLQASSNVGIAGTFTRGTMTVTPGANNTVTFNGDVQTMTGNATTFTNLTIANTSLTAPADFTVNSTFSTTSPAVLNMTSNILTVTGNYTGTGALSFSSGTFNLSGAFTNTGTFTCGTGTVNFAGNAAQTIRGVNYYNLTFSGTGSKTLQAAATIGIAATFTRGTMTVTSGATNTVLFNGTNQIMTGSGLAFTNLTLNNSSLTIPADITVNATLTFTSGNIITNAFNVLMATAGTVSRTSGHVIGNLRKNVAVGSNVTRTFEVGTGNDYTPLTFAFTSVTTAGNLTASSTAGDHPSIATSGFNASSTINRYWTVTNSTIAYSTYNVTASFVNADKDAGYNTANSIIKMYNGSTWVLTNGGTQTANAAQALAVALPVTPNTAYIQIGQIVPSPTGNLYSIASNNWSTPGTWSSVSGGASCNCIPTSLDNVFIENNYTVVMNGTNGVAKSLTIQTGGKANWTTASTTDIGTGGISITSAGDITGTVAGILTTAGGLTLNKVLTSTTVTIKTASVSGQIIAGTGTLARLDISTNTTNNGNLTVSTILASTIASTLTQGTGAALTYNGTSFIPVLDASASGNSVTYGGAAQTVRSATYYNLTISGSNTKTLGGNISVNNNLTINAGTLATSTFQIVGNTTGNFTMAASTLLYLGLNSSATDVYFPSLFTNAHISFASNSTVVYYGNNAQIVSSVPTYGNLIVQTYSGLKTANGNITVAGTLTSTSPTTFTLGANTLNVTGTYAGTGVLSFSTGTFNLAGTFTNTGTFSCGTSTVNYNGNSAQTIRGVNYYHLTFSGTGIKTLQAAATIGIAGNFTRGTMTVTPGTTNTVLFNGAAQVMTGSATSFTNLTLTNASLTIPADITINSSLTFTTGNLITNAFNVILPATGSVSRISGHVIGNLRKNVATGSNVSKTFEVGTNGDYAPLTLLFSSVATTGNITVSTISGDHPAISSSGFNPAYTINRYWTVSNTSLVYTNYSATASFVNGDKDAGLTTANDRIKIYNGSTWTLPTAGTQTSNSSQATAIAIPVSSNTIHLQIGDNNPSITGNLYSIASGNWTASGTWSTTSGGTSCFCAPTSVNNAIIENNFTVTMNGSPGVAQSITVQTGGKANWTSALTTDIGSGGINITSTGDVTGSAAGVLTTSGGLILNKVLTSTAVTIKTTTASQNISGTGTLANLEINVDTYNNGNITLTDLLTISGGTFTNNLGTFTLKADASKYARIAPISAGCSSCKFAGNFTIQRYIPARVASWTDLSSPVSNSTMADWDNELFLEYPFVGFDVVNNRPGGTNVMAYDELSANYYQLSSATPLAPGKGFEIGLTDDNRAVSFSATTLTTVGTPNYNTITIPLSYTAANGPAYPVGYSGENLIGNPFASAITLSSILKTNTLSSVDVYDYTIDNYKTLTGSDIIGPHQGFWAYAQSTGASFVIPESAKSTNSNTALHRTAENEEEERPYLSLTIASADGSHMMAHTLEIACSEKASDGWDEKDHPFRRSLNPKAPSITASAGKVALSISTFSNKHNTYVMPLNLKIGVNGLYHIHTAGIKNVNRDFALILLEDKLTHTFVDLNNSMDYTFSAQTTDLKDRFVLHFSKTLDYKPTSITTAVDLGEEIQIFKTNTGNLINFNSGKSQNMNISVIDIMGRAMIYDLNAQANDREIILTLPSDFHGWYIVVIESANGKTVKKFIQL